MNDDDATDWERFSHGTLRDDRRSPRTSVLDGLAALILSAAVVLMLASVVYAFDFFGASLRDRAFIVAVDAGSALNAALVLGAVLVAVLGGEPDSPLRRRTMTCAIGVGGLLVACALYVIAFAALHHPHFDPTSSVAELRAAQAAADWSARVQTMLMALASGLLATAAVYMARRARETVQPTP